MRWKQFYLAVEILQKFDVDVEMSCDVIGARVVTCFVCFLGAKVLIVAVSLSPIVRRLLQLPSLLYNLHVASLAQSFEDFVRVDNMEGDTWLTHH